MNIHEFIAKWSKVSLTERSASQQHFIDLCAVLDHPTPAEVDPTGEWFTFEKGAVKHGGADGWADVWKRDYFGWEYKGRHKNLEAAYDQLLLYREDLQNPPLMVVCDMDRIVIHTNFTATAKRVYEFSLSGLSDMANLAILRAVFHDPYKLKPGTTSEAVTQDAASRLAEIAHLLRARGINPRLVAQFLDRVIFCLFAEDIGLLPAKLFTELLAKAKHDPPRLCKLISQLFEAMARGGDFGLESIRNFDGNLFKDANVLELMIDEIERIWQAAKLDWSAVDPSILGTLFERGLDPDKRSQLGAHYTSREDIETIVEPVVMQPLHREWRATQAQIEPLLTTKGTALTKKRKGQIDVLIHRFLTRLTEVRVLDPACGSGNFLYVTLQKLKDLEKEVIVYAMDKGIGSFLPHVGPWQLYGIEVNPYAFDLAQMTIWIGYLQWTRANGFGISQDPILKPMDNFLCVDAVINQSDPDNPVEPEWPPADFIVGNPPFLGDKLMRSSLGDDYVRKLRKLYFGRLPGSVDLCCYWFEKAYQEIKTGRCRRAGLLATQGIRGGANRKVLERIKTGGDIFFAISDRPWILDGANVHVSMVGFDDGTDKAKLLDDASVAVIHADLTANVDTTKARQISSVSIPAFVGVSMHGDFDIGDELALEMLTYGGGNPNGVVNSDVLRPILNASEIYGRPEHRWVIYFPSSMPKEEAAYYQQPFEYVVEHVKPARATNNRRSYRERWWVQGEARSAMVDAMKTSNDFIATSRVGKHRLFVWMTPPILPSDAIVAFITGNSSMFGILHSRIHEVWARRQGTQLRERKSGFRYTPTTCFDTFPFPHLNSSSTDAIGKAADELNELRTRWLNPPEWTRKQELEFPASTSGPWATYLIGPAGPGEVGTARYTRLVPADTNAAIALKQRTLTALYNQNPTWLVNAHRELDEAVFDAYGIGPTDSDEQILAALMVMNIASSLS
jgi:hypothetical protein